MNVRAATAQDAAGIVALHKAANPYKDWYRNPVQRLGRTPYEALTPMERFLHGGFWMDLSLFRRHYHEYLRRGFPVLIAEDRGKIVGECEVWLDKEPAPFGAYAEVETLASGSPPNPDVEREIIERVAERVRKIGYEALDLSPQHSGGESAAKALPFDELWDTRTFTADLDAIPKPEVEFETRFLGGDFRDLEGLLLLDHREPARWRFETLAALWPAAQVAGLPDATKAVAVAVEIATGIKFAVLAARRAWLVPPSAEVDVWMEPADAKTAKRIEEAFRIAVEVARRLDAPTVTTYAPQSAAKALRSLGFSGGEAPDPWLRWTFS